MRICLVGPTYPFRGGISHYTTVLCRELRSRHEVYLVSLRKQYPRWLFPGRTQKDESREVLAVDNDPVLRPLHPPSWSRAYRRIVDFGPDLVLFQWWHPYFAPCFGALARRLVRRAGIRTAYLVHNARSHERSPIERILTAYALRAPSCFVAHSEEDRRGIERVRPGASIEIGPHPAYDVFRADDGLAPEEARRRLGVPEAETLLFFGYVRRYKGLPLLLDALARVREKRDCRLLVVGEFYHDRRETYEKIRDHRLAGAVTLVDRYVPNEEVRLYFASADLVVLPYRSASQSGVAQIAFSFGKPVVATRVGGLPEVVEEGITGLLVPPDDTVALGDAIETFFRDGLAERMVSNIERSRHRFSWAAMVERIERIAEEAGRESNATPGIGAAPRAAGERSPAGIGS
jgi:glycosyltransferase involved in cell wall biosynthesis